MELPDFLAADDGGFIHATGHRIGLHHIVRVYNDGYSVEMIVGHYPTLPLSLVHKMIAFYLENQVEVDAYVAAHDREMEPLMAQASTTPTLVELRARLTAMQRAEVRPSAAPAEL